MARIQRIDGTLISADIIGAHSVGDEGARSGFIVVAGEKLPVYRTIVDGLDWTWYEQAPYCEGCNKRDIPLSLYVVTVREVRQTSDGNTFLCEACAEIWRGAKEGVYGWVLAELVEGEVSVCVREGAKLYEVVAHLSPAAAVQMIKDIHTGEVDTEELASKEWREVDQASIDRFIGGAVVAMDFSSGEPGQ